MMVTTPLPKTVPGTKQLVFATMIAAVFAVAVFLCGVLVGQGVASRREAGTTSSVTAGDIADDSRAGERGMPDSDESALDTLSYFDRLTGTDAGSDTLPVASISEGESADRLWGGSGEGAFAGDAPFVLHVTALRGEVEARAMASGLMEKGYPAYVVDPTPGAPLGFHRVQIGPYTDLAEAEAVRLRLESIERLRPSVIQP